MLRHRFTVTVRNPTGGMRTFATLDEHEATNAVAEFGGTIRLEPVP